MDMDQQDIPRQSMDADIVCVGFGPATAGFLTTLSKGLVNPDGTPVVESKVMPGMPPQIICYERADDIGFGVSGVVSRARGIKASFPEEDLTQIPLCAKTGHEKVVYLLDPVGASRRPKLLQIKEKCFRALKKVLPVLPLRDEAFELPYIPPFLRKEDGLTFSLGQFLQWAGGQVMGSGLAQIWPSTPVSQALIEGGRVAGVRLTDQGVDKEGNPEGMFMPGMDVKAALTVVADGPVGPVGRQIDRELGMPCGNHRREWAVGMKFVVDLPERCELPEGTILHTLGYPEPEIFGFLYVLPGRVASLGIFIPSWFDNPVRTAYRYLQHWMRHPYLWKHLEGGTLRSWGAKSLLEDGRKGEPHLAGHGYARIGEGSGTTNVLTGSGVDEAWTSGVLLAEATLELLRDGKEFSKENLEATYVRRRRESWLDEESKAAEKARDGFTKGFIQGLVGMALSGFSNGKINWPGCSKRVYERIPTIEEYYQGRITVAEINAVRAECKAKGLPLHGALMTMAGWPDIEYDGQLLISHQDALLMGGKVQANPGYADHVRFKNPDVCRTCDTKICIEACSGQAITTNPDDGVPLFDREKCVHCGACMWNCSKADKQNPEETNVDFRAGSGGLHSAEN